MNLKNLGLEELSLSEKKEVNGGMPWLWPLVTAVIAACGGAYKFGSDCAKRDNARAGY